MENHYLNNQLGNHLDTMFHMPMERGISNGEEDFKSVANVLDVRYCINFHFF